MGTIAERDEVLRELALSRAWNAQWLRPGAALRTTDGQPLTVVYRGRWTHNFGPDFQGALVAFGAELRQGDVELHLRAANWRAHGHHLNPAYNGVILHVVLEGDARPCRRQDGATVPTLVLGPLLRDRLDRLPPDPALPPLGALADTPCIAEVTVANRAAALAALERAGDARLTAKAAAIEAAFTATPPGQALYAGLLDALGYSRNREPMARLAAVLPLAMVEAALPDDAPGGGAGAFHAAAALLLGVAGFLPLAPALAELCALAEGDREAIEAEWSAAREAWRDLALAPGGWSLARVRPANHPARRLLGMAGLLARSARSGLLAGCLEPFAAEEPAEGLAELRALLLGPERPGDPHGRYLGADRAAEMLINVLIPFALAYATWAGDERLAAGAAALWEVAPASGGNEQVRALVAQLGGERALRLRTGRQQQGALHLYRQYCTVRRCYECPIARLERRRG